MRIARKFTVVASLLLAASMTFTACTPQENNTPNTTTEGTTESVENAVEQTLVWNIGADPKTLDPGLNSAVDGGHVINNTFEGLMRDKGGSLDYAMAESHEVSEDGLVYTFKIREDAKWSDGKPVTAADFEFAWKRVADPATASEYSFIMESGNIKNASKIIAGEMDKEELGVKALDEKTLEVTLEQPTDFFLSLTAFATYMPVRSDVVDSEGAWAKDPAKAISNGPFKLAEYTMGDQLVLVKNEEYWNKDNVKLEKIVGKMIVDSSTHFTAYNANELQIITEPPSEEIPRLIAEDPTFYTVPQIGTYFYVLNLNNELYQNPQVRQALSLAIDRKKIVEQVVRGGQEPTVGFMPPGIKDNEGKDFSEVAEAKLSLASVEGDVEKAKALLAEAGYPNGEGFPEIEIMYNTGSGHQIIAEAVQEMWKKNLNINVKLTNQEWAVFQETRNNIAYSDIARHGWIGDYADPQTMLEIFETGSPQNNGGYSNAEFDTHMKASRTAVGKERMDHLYAAYEILMNDLPMIPIYHYVNNVMVKDSVQGWEFNPLGKFWFGDTEIVAVEE